MVRMGIFVAAIACLTTYEWNQYHSHILRFYSWDLSRRDAVLSVASLVAKTLVMVLPFIAAGYVLKRHHRHRLGNAIDAVVPLGIFLWLFLDVKIQTMTGQHVSYYLARLASSGQLKMVGAPHRLIIPLLLPVVGLAAFAGIIWALIAWFPKRHGDDNAEKSKDLVTPWFLVVGAGCVLSLLIARRSVDNSAVLERLYAALPTAAFFFHPGSVGDQGRGTFGDDVQQLFEPLGRRFFNVSRLGSVAEFETEHSDVDRPHVILLILESFRNESISEQRMPKVAQWAKGGLVANRHYCGSNCSPQGGFALMHGQLAMTYDAVLDTGKDATFCTMMRQLGYRSTLLASCDFEYRRMNELFSQPDFDRVELFSLARDQWPEADQKCIQEIESIVSDAIAPQFIVAYLMSTHYDYRYPEQYEALNPESEILGELTSSNPDELETRIRYRRSLAFMDQLIDVFLQTIDLDNTIVLVTGDHGESIHDDGTLSHGSRLSEIQTLVPMFMVGRNIPEQVIHSVTSHVDVIPTIADAIGVSYTSTAGKHGSSWLSQNAVSHAQLLVHEYPDSWDVAIIDGSLSESGEKLMLNIDRTDGACRILGFAGSDGLINPSFRKSPSDAKRWANRFLSAIAALETDHP